MASFKGKQGIWTTRQLAQTPVHFTSPSQVINPTTAASDSCDGRLQFSTQPTRASAAASEGISPMLPSVGTFGECRPARCSARPGEPALPFVHGFLKRGPSSTVSRDAAAPMVSRRLHPWQRPASSGPSTSTGLARRQTNAADCVGAPPSHHCRPSASALRAPSPPAPYTRSRPGQQHSRRDDGRIRSHRRGRNGGSQHGRQGTPGRDKKGDATSSA